MADLSTLHPIFIRAAAAAASAAPAGSASTNGTAGGAPTRRKKPVEWVRKATGFWHWYIVAAIIAVLAVVYALRLYRNYAQRKRSIADRKAGKTTSAPGGFSRTWSATSVLTSNFLYVRSFPLALYSGTNVSEIFFSVAYLGVCLGLTMYKTYREFVANVVEAEAKVRVRSIQHRAALRNDGEYALTDLWSNTDERHMSNCLSLSVSPRATIPSLTSRVSPTRTLTTCIEQPVECATCSRGFTPSRTVLKGM